MVVSLTVEGVRATGMLMHAGAIEVIRYLGSTADVQGEDFHLLTMQSGASPVAIMSGPPISKGGTFSSQDNAVEVVLSVRLRPETRGEPWSTRLTISAAPSR